MKVTAGAVTVVLTACCTAVVDGFPLRPKPSISSQPLRRPWSREHGARTGVSLRAKNDEDTERMPFFARLRDAWKEKKDDDSTAMEAEGGKNGGAVAVAERIPAEDELEPKRSNDPQELASELRAQAEKVRLEAERMEAVLTLDKIESLQKKLDSKSLLEKHPEEAADIRKQLQSLTDKLNGPKPTKPVEAKTEMASLQPAPMVTESEVAPMPNLEADLKSLNITTATRDDLYDMIPPMPESELKAKAEAFRKTPQLLQEMTARSAGFDDASNASAIVEQMYKDEQVTELKKKKRASGQVEPMGEEALAEALEGYMKLPLPIQDLIAKSVGMEDGRNASAVITKLEEEGKLFSEGNGVNGFEVDTEFISDVDVSEIFKEAEAIERDRFIESQLPVATRKRDQIPSQDDVEIFFKEVLGKDTFNPTEKPISVPGGFLIYGENRKKNGEVLVAALDKELAKTNLPEKLQYFYMVDPSPISREQLESLEGPDEKPAVLFIAGPDISPNTNKFLKPFVSLLGITFMASFALGSLTLNEAAMNRFFDQLDSGVADLSWIETNAFPIFAGLCLTQLGHETAHQIVAWRDKFKAGLPTIVPSLQVGLTGGITPIETSPKNVKSLFDFALAGPLAGMTVSIALMLSGLEATAFMDAAAQGNLPSLPVNLVRSSSLAGAMIQGVLGEGILLTPNPALDTINLHPLAIAGFVGLVSNALSLLPLGNTDGGRVAQALFGRSWCRILTTFTSLFMVISGLFGADQANLLLFYAFYATVAQRETEIPCRNEVDDLDVGRASVALASFFLVMLTLIPMS